MLQIYVYPNQFALLPLLWAWFPGLVVKQQCESSRCYLAPLGEGEQGREQERFLRQHTIEYVDLERERETFIRAFFTGVELEGKLITRVDFGRVQHTTTYHWVRLQTEDTEVCLRFPPDWSPCVVADTLV